MKLFALLALFCAFAFLAACSHTEYLAMNSTEKRAPLDSTVQVSFVYAPDVPVIPENTELVAVMSTNVNSDCAIDDAIKSLENTARSIGADLVFVKKYDKVWVSSGTSVGGVYVSTGSTECHVLTADLLATKKGE